MKGGSGGSVLQVMVDLLSIERRRRIVDVLARRGAVRVTDLAQQLAVAEETVRRDLKVLDGRGLVQRTHGGAVTREVSGAAGLSSGAVAVDTSFEQRRQEKLEQKQAIARLAVRGIVDGQTIALDGSTTALELATVLPEMTAKGVGVTVVTNSVVIAGRLAGRVGVQVICTGGVLDADLKMMTGTLAVEALERLNIDVAFFSCRGVDVRRGYTDPTDAGATFKKALVKRAGRSVVVADSSKFEVRGAVMIGAVDSVDEVITDDLADGAVIRGLRRAGVKVSVARVLAGGGVKSRRKAVVR